MGSSTQPNCDPMKRVMREGGLMENERCDMMEGCEGVIDGW